jgi:glycosyltransferase involved in cell wall biosynthesis
VGYICAFPGRRDSYQVPVALAQAGLLDCFITDYYWGPSERALSHILPRRLSERVRQRFDAGIPSHRIRRLRLTAAAALLVRAVGRPAAAIYERFDPRYGEIAADEARRRRSHLFMYSPHAWSAFSARYNHRPRKVLFQFHPHHELERIVLKADAIVCERAGISFTDRIESLQDEVPTGRVLGDAAWQLADHVVCASSFTRTSILGMGAKPEQVSVAPYGVTVEPVELDGNIPTGETFRALFVGSGVQRKGLHHLLLAWRRANLPAGARLTVVARVLDAGLAPLVASTPGVELRRGVTQGELRGLYGKATLFAMPSLIEGFGQVYLEALAHSLPVLGTAHTCCPDLGTETDGVYVTAPGSVDELAASLERLARVLPGNTAVRQRARECAARFTWAGFRRQIQTIADTAA